MKILVSLILFFFTSVSFSQDAESLLKSLQNRFDGIEDLSVNVSQSLGGNNNLSGKLFYKKGNKLRIEFPGQTIVADGNTTWNYNKRDRKVIISSYEETGSGLLSINYLIYQYPSECELSLSKQGIEQILILKPKSNKSKLGEVKLFITKDNLIKKTVISNQSSGTTEVVFTNYKLNQKIPDSQFSFSLPEGTSVVDLR